MRPVDIAEVIAFIKIDQQSAISQRKVPWHGRNHSFHSVVSSTIIAQVQYRYILLRRLSYPLRRQHHWYATLLYSLIPQQIDAHWWYIVGGITVVCLVIAAAGGLGNG